MPEGLPVEVVNQVLWRIPNVLCLIGAAAGEEWNGMTASWVTQVSLEPVLVAAAVDRASLTHRLIVEGRCFSVNLWSRDDTRIFVTFAKPARRDGDSLNGRPVRRGVTGAPIFTEAVAYVDCHLRSALDCGTHTVFVGEVADCGFQDGGAEKAVARIEDTRMRYGGVQRRAAGR